MDAVQKERQTPETDFGDYNHAFTLLNPDVCEYMPKNTPFTLEETIKGAEASIEITTEYPCFVVRNLDKNAPMKFLNPEDKAVSKCADHAAFLFVDGKWILHIFECKRTQYTSKWKDVVKQFNGGVIRACAVAGVLRIPEFSDVHLHLCYRKDKSSPATLKTLPGKPAPPNFLKSKITLFSYPELAVKNAPIELNPADGRASIQLNERGVT